MNEKLQNGQTDEVKVKGGEENNQPDQIENKENDTSQEILEKSSETEINSSEEQEAPQEDTVPQEEEQDEDVESIDSQDVMEAYLKSFGEIREGSIVTGQIVEVADEYVMVNVGYKTDGMIRREEFKSMDISPGDEVEVMVIKLEDKNGNLILSRFKAEDKRLWDDIFNSYKQNKSVKGKVEKAVKGGYEVRIGHLTAFCPKSHIDIRQVSDDKEYLGKELDFQVIKVEKGRRKNIVVSRKEWLKNYTKARFKEILNTCKPGDRLKGVVSKLTDFGAFVDLEGTEGLIHISDISWGRIDKPEDVLKEGQEIEVVLLKINEETQKISLGLKQLKENPWNVVDKNFIPGEIVKGMVRNITNFGIFVEIDEGVEGLVHINDISWQGVSKIEDEVKIGEVIPVRIMKIDKENKKVALSMKHVVPDPWLNIEKKYKVDSVVRGKVKNIMNYGAFIELENGVEGLCHISDMSWTSRVKHPKEVVGVGEFVDVKILSIDAANRKISLGIKQVYPEPWEVIEEKYKVGFVYEGKVKDIKNFGAFIELEPGIEGLLHVSDISWGKKISSPREVLKINDTVKVKILDINCGEKKVALGMKQVYPDPWESVYDKFKPGSVVEGEITKLVNFGAFVKLDKDLEGLLHISDMTWEKPPSHPSKLFKVGDKIKVKILDIDAEERKIALGVKQLTKDPWAEFSTLHPKGSVVEGKVTRIVDFGVFVEVAPNIEGLVHVSEVAPQRVEKIEDVVATSETVLVKILDISVPERKLKLSIKGAAEVKEKEEYLKYLEKEKSSQTVSLAEALGSDLLKKIAKDSDDKKDKK